MDIFQVPMHTIERVINEMEDHMMGHHEFKRKATTVVTAYQAQLPNYLTEDSGSETSYDTDWTEDDSGDETDFSEEAKKKREKINYYGKS